MDVTTQPQSGVEVRALADSSAVVITTDFSALLSADERTGWRPNGHPNEPFEYPPAVMSDEDWFGPEGGR